MLVSRSTSSAIAASARSHTIKKAEAKQEKVKEAATIQREVHSVSYVLFPIRRKSRRGTEGTVAAASHTPLELQTPPRV